MCSQSQEDKWERAKSAGRLAQQRGLLKTENPHTDGSILFDFWLEGYTEADAREEHDLKQIEE
jgi:hypothetical protein